MPTTPQSKNDLVEILMSKIDDQSHMLQQMCDLNVSVKILTEKYQIMHDDLQQLKKDLKEISDKPINTMNAIKASIITSLVGATVGLLIGYFRL